METQPEWAAFSFPARSWAWLGWAGGALGGRLRAGRRCSGRGARSPSTWAPGNTSQACPVWAAISLAGYIAFGMSCLAVGEPFGNISSFGFGDILGDAGGAWWKVAWVLLYEAFHMRLAHTSCACVGLEAHESVDNLTTIGVRAKSGRGGKSLISLADSMFIFPKTCKWWGRGWGYEKSVSSSSRSKSRKCDFQFTHVDSRLVFCLGGVVRLEALWIKDLDKFSRVGE